jgi:hypothetical protein
MKKQLSRYSKLFAIASLTAALAGCAGHVRVPLEQILSLGLSKLPEDMQYTNMYALVHPDMFPNLSNTNEAPFWHHTLVGKGALHAGG